MQRRHIKTLRQIYLRPTSSNILWKDVEALSPYTDKGAVASIRKWFEHYEVKP